MYRILAGDDLIYSPTLISKGYILTAAQLNMELNKASTLTITIPDKSARKAFIDGYLKKEITVWDDDRRLFRGRIISKKKDFYQSSEVYCEGELAYLRDRIIRPYEQQNKTPAQFFDWILSEYNSLDSAYDAYFAYKRFVKGNCNVTGDAADFKSDQYPDALSEMTDKLLNGYGGFFVPRYEVENGVGKNYLDYLTLSNDTVATQKIRYGKNLLDLTEENTAASTFSVVIPLGGTVDGSRITISQYSGDPDFIEDDTAISDYGWIENVVTHDAITSSSELRTAGEQDLTSAVLTQKTIEISAIDLSLINESDDPLTLGKSYKILFLAGGYDAESPALRLSRCEINLLNPAESRYYFGVATTGISHEAASTKRTMNQVTQLALSTAASNGELATKVDDLQTSLQNLASDVAAIKEPVTVHTTVDSISWTANTNGGKTATISVNKPSGAQTNYKCSAAVTTSGAVVFVGGINKGASTVGITLINFGDTDPSSLDLDVIFFN